MTEFLADRAKQVLLVLGESGAGKSLSLAVLADELRADSTAAGHERLILNIPLAALQRPSSHLLIEGLQRIDSGFSDSDAAALRARPLALLLDGYDEMADYCNLFVTNQVRCPGSSPPSPLCIRAHCCTSTDSCTCAPTSNSSSPAVWTVPTAWRPRTSPVWRASSPPHARMARNRVLSSLPPRLCARFRRRRLTLTWNGTWRRRGLRQSGRQPRSIAMPWRRYPGWRCWPPRPFCCP